MNIDFQTLSKMVELMNDTGKHKNLLVCKNQDGENVIIKVNSDIICTETFQKNGWCRKKLYYSDGSTEEIYER